MDNTIDFGVKMARILEQDKRYQPEAYDFVMQGLHYTLAKIGEHRHISGKELALGIKEYAITQYGPMAKTVLEHWGVRNTLDFGEIVFNAVDAGLMKKRPEDKKEDFMDVYNFEDAFDKPFKRSLRPVQKNAVKVKVRGSMYN